MSIERIPAPGNDDWSDTAEAREWARVNFDTDEENIEFVRLAEAAAIEAEAYAEIALLTQSIRILLPSWPRGHVRLPVIPILNRDSVNVTINAHPWADILIGTGSRPLLMICGNPPPGVVVIEYKAGFGAKVADIPADIRQAMIDQVALLYDSRGAVAAKDITLSPQFIRVLGRYRGVRL